MDAPKIRPPVIKKKKKKVDASGYSSEDARDLPNKRLAPIKRTNSANKRLPAPMQSHAIGFNSSSTIMEKRAFKKPKVTNKR
jgi:hypothetical protein